MRRLLDEYKEKYGEDNAQYLMEMEQDWMREYNCALYVDWDSISSEKHAEYTKNCADYLGWEYKTESGSSSLVRDMFDGRWDDERFLIVPPGRTVAPSYDESILKLGDNK